MTFKEAANYLGRKVRHEDNHLGIDGEYILTACILRKNAGGFISQVELQREHSVLITTLDRIHPVEKAGRTEDSL